MFAKNVVAALLLPLFVLAYIYFYSILNANSPNYYLNTCVVILIDQLPLFRTTDNS